MLKSSDSDEVFGKCLPVYGATEQNKDWKPEVGSWMLSSGGAEMFYVGVNSEGKHVFEFKGGGITKLDSLSGFSPIKSDSAKWVEQARAICNGAADGDELASLYQATKCGKLPWASCVDQVKPEQVIADLLDSVVGALDSGFIDSNTLTIGEFYRIAQKHLKDRYQVQIPCIAERYGQEIAEMAGGLK